MALFGLAQQLLSRQQHYDWGLRALKTCLAISGRLLREHRAAGQQLNQVSETQIIIRGVRLATTPKLTFDDTNRYHCHLQKLTMTVLAEAGRQFTHLALFFCHCPGTNLLLLLSVFAAYRAVWQLL